MTLSKVTSQVSERSRFCPSRGERDPSEMKLPGPVSTEASVLPVGSRVPHQLQIRVLSSWASLPSWRTFLWQLVHAQGRENGGITASSPSHSSQEIWRQGGHKSIISRANVPVCRLIPSFSLKSLKIRKENLEKSLRKP